jgi:hypothetical protein
MKKIAILRLVIKYDFHRLTVVTVLAMSVITILVSIWAGIIKSMSAVHQNFPMTGIIMIITSVLVGAVRLTQKVPHDEFLIHLGFPFTIGIALLVC